jgi:hypothetical protein
MKVKAKQVVLEHFQKIYKDKKNTIDDEDNRTKFGTYFCDLDNLDFKFIWQSCDGLKSITDSAVHLWCSFYKIIL